MPCHLVDADRIGQEEGIVLSGLDLHGVLDEQYGNSYQITPTAGQAVVNSDAY
jgi:hypothetical protein